MHWHEMPDVSDKGSKNHIAEATKTSDIILWEISLLFVELIKFH